MKLVYATTTYMYNLNVVSVKRWLLREVSKSILRTVLGGLNREGPRLEVSGQTASCTEMHTYNTICRHIGTYGDLECSGVLIRVHI